MTVLSLIHYTAFMIYLYLIFLVVAKNPKAALNRICALLICCFAIWSLGGTIFYAVTSENNAKLWCNISAFGGVSFASFHLWFSLKLTNRERLLKKWYFYWLLFSIPAFFVYLHWAGNLARVVKELNGWAIVWPLSTWTILFYVYYLSFTFTSIYLIYRFGQSARYEYERKQAKLIVILSLIALVVGSINVILLPSLKFYLIPSMGSVTPLIWIAGIAYAITKYKLMVPTPAYAASDILATMSDSLILIGSDGKLIEANTATLNILGYSREELIGRPVEILLSSTEASFLKEIEILEQLFQKSIFNNYHIFYRAKNGTSIPVSISGSILRDHDHNLIGIVGVARDLRELIRLQEQERSYIVEKARSQVFQERAQELQDAYGKLQTIQAQLIQNEKMAAVGLLAGGVAHEINNPMGVILGFAQSIAKRISETDPLYLPLRSIEREAERCKNLVNNLLTFSRAGKTQAELMDVNGVIDQTLSLIETQTKVKNIEIVKKYEPNLPQIMANKNQLQQVILNICNNAIDAIDANPIPDSARVITIDTGNNVTQIEITISDTGHGMTEAVKNHLFEPFFTTKEVGKGTGLGLSLCYEIIRKHQGILEVESEAGKGSTFIIKLPINETSTGLMGTVATE
ncbi:MAG TPA: ATP-binding protein [Bacillota bacterium]|nr:ATP-binding protein [Bacillota bacterium]